MVKTTEKIEGTQFFYRFVIDEDGKAIDEEYDGLMNGIQVYSATPTTNKKKNPERIKMVLALKRTEEFFTLLEKPFNELPKIGNPLFYRKLFNIIKPLAKGHYEDLKPILPCLDHSSKDVLAFIKEVAADDDVEDIKTAIEEDMLAVETRKTTRTKKTHGRQSKLPSDIDLSGDEDNEVFAEYIKVLDADERKSCS